MQKRKLEIIMAAVLLIATVVTVRVGFAVPAATTAKEPTKDDGKMTVVIDPGHGGDDPGKIGINDALEKDINLSISFYLKDNLEAAGYNVIMTRTDGSGLYTSSDYNKKLADMKKRCEIIETNNADIVVSVHQNSYNDGAVTGSQVFYYTHSTEGKRLAETIQMSFKTNVDENNTRMAKSNDSYYMLLHTPCPTVICECGFLSNWEEASRLCTDEYQIKLAAAISEGIKQYLGK